MYTSPIGVFLSLTFLSSQIVIVICVFHVGELFRGLKASYMHAVALLAQAEGSNLTEEEVTELKKKYAAIMNVNIHIIMNVNMYRFVNIPSGKNLSSCLKLSPSFCTRTHNIYNYIGINIVLLRHVRYLYLPPWTSSSLINVMIYILLYLFINSSLVDLYNDRSIISARQRVDDILATCDLNGDQMVTFNEVHN